MLLYFILLILENIYASGEEIKTYIHFFVHSVKYYNLIWEALIGKFRSKDKTL